MMFWLWVQYSLLLLSLHEPIITYWQISNDRLILADGTAAGDLCEYGTQPSRLFRDVNTFCPLVSKNADAYMCMLHYPLNHVMHVCHIVT